jgi:hypothetical protein
MVRFIGVGSPLGFDSSTPGFPTSPDLVMDSTGQNFPASNLPSAGSVLYGLEHCLLVAGDPACQPSVLAGTAYTDLVTLTLDSTPAAAPPVESGLYIVLAGMSSTGYTPEDVMFDTAGSAAPEVDPLLYFLLDSGGTEYHFFGFRFTQIGESRTLRYDVTGMAASGTPIILTSAYLPVPEPGTGSLLALGLISLAAWRRR